MSFYPKPSFYFTVHLLNGRGTSRWSECNVRALFCSSFLWWWKGSFTYILKHFGTLCFSSKVNLLSSIAQNYESGVIFLRQSVFSFPRSPGITPGAICPGRDPWFHFVDHVTFTQSSLAQSERRTKFKGTGLYWFLLRQILILGNV